MARRRDHQPDAGHAGCGAAGRADAPRPVPNGLPGFTLPNGFGEGIEHLPHFEEGSFSSVTGRIFPLQGVLPKGVIPFAEALGGNVLCFNYRGNYDNPTVEFWGVDTGPVPMASSFTDLLSKLHE